MKVSKRMREQIFCVFAQSHGDSIKQKHIRLEVNDWRLLHDKKPPVGVHYFGMVMRQLESEGLCKIIRATQTPYWDDFKVWAWAGK